jgi:hypothetical protein
VPYSCHRLHMYHRVQASELSQDDTRRQKQPLQADLQELITRKQRKRVKKKKHSDRMETVVSRQLEMTRAKRADLVQQRPHDDGETRTEAVNNNPPLAKSTAHTAIDKDPPIAL